MRLVSSFRFPLVSLRFRAAVRRGKIAALVALAALGAGVAHFAHLGGMLGGLIMIRRWRSQQDQIVTAETLSRGDF